MRTHRIVRRWNDAVLWEGEAETVKDALHEALAAGASLRGANLRDADLTGADLRGADLTDATLTDANLRDADLTGADLRGADLTDATLTDANLRDADLTGADLRGANLTPIRDDIWAVLSGAPAEVPALLDAIKGGRINGSQYSGACACLVGTIANARHCDTSQLGEALKPNADRPAEKFFLAIREGDTPDTNPFSKLAAEWVEDWLTRMRGAFSGEKA
jgi:hypothetical protein